jgi:hypothetical protein
MAQAVQMAVLVVQALAAQTAAVVQVVLQAQVQMVQMQVLQFFCQEALLEDLVVTVEARVWLEG